jgi:hypothetical protein
VLQKTPSARCSSPLYVGYPCQDEWPLGSSLRGARTREARITPNTGIRLMNWPDRAEPNRVTPSDQNMKASTDAKSAI